VNAKVAIQNLEELATEMEEDTGIFESGGGRFANTLHDSLRSRTAIRRRDQAKNFANTTLKELFGGQLSDAEREAAAKEYYNDALNNEENSLIIRRKVAQLKEGYQSELQKAQFFENNRTLYGFRGASNLPMVSQSGGKIKQDDSGGGAFSNEAYASSEAPPKIGASEDGYTYLGGDPSNAKSWKRVK